MFNRFITQRFYLFLRWETLSKFFFEYDDTETENVIICLRKNKKNAR